MSIKGIELNERDFIILKSIYKFRFCLGRHIKVFAGFTGQGACDRRLKKLIESKYIERKRYFYGIPYIYTLSHRGRMLLGVNKRAENIKLEQVHHDITVLDTVIYYMKKYNINLDNILSEKELHSINGFTSRKHAPDFIFDKDNIKTAYEIELTPKAFETLSKNVKTNYLNYDEQIWITDNKKVRENLEKLKDEYDLEIMDLENKGVKSSGK